MNKPIRRGDINNPRCARRMRTFSGLQRGPCGPSDIDCSIDFNFGQLFIFVEGKEIGAEVKTGQRQHLECLVCAIAQGQGKAIAAIIEYAPGPEDDCVDYAECRVVKYFTAEANEWLSPAGERTLGDFYDWQLKKHKLSERYPKVFDDQSP